MLDDKILDRARRCIKVKFAECRRVFPKEVNRVIQEVVNITGGAQCSETFVRVHDVCAREVGTRTKIVFDSLLRVHKTHGSPITNTLATALKQEVGYHIEAIVEEISKYMIQRLPMSKSDAHHFNFENTKSEVKEKFDVEVDLYVDSLLCKPADKEQDKKKTKKAEKSEKKFQPWKNSGDACFIIEDNRIKFYYKQEAKDLRLRNETNPHKLLFLFAAKNPLPQVENKEYMYKKDKAL